MFIVCSDTWFSDIVNYLIFDRIPEEWTKNDQDKFFHLVKFFVWDDPYLFKYCSKQNFRRCVPNHETRSVLSFCHDQACGGHFSGKKTAAEVLQCGFYWLIYLGIPLRIVSIDLGASSWVGSVEGT